MLPSEVSNEILGRESPWTFTHGGLDDAVPIFGLRVRGSIHTR